MYSTQIKIVNRTGFHARPAADFVALAGKFRSTIEVQRVGEEDSYNGKSIVMLLALGLSQGEEATITANGEDERDAVEALAALINNLQE
ncbi:MAG: HPr family phosphocarrier protein [Pseudoflavonifractor sp.]